MNLKLKMEVDVPEELLSDLMITAFDGTYGGCTSYGCFEAVSYDIDPDKSTGGWKAVTIRELPEDGKPFAEHRVTWETLVLGMQRLLNKNDLRDDIREAIQEAVFNADGGEIDAGMIDTIVQFGLFNQEKYS